MKKLEYKNSLKFILPFLIGFFVLHQTSLAQNLSSVKDTTIHAKLLRFGTYVLVLPNDKQYLQKDTIDVLDIGAMSNLCPTVNNSLNGDFGFSEYNIFQEHWAEELYYDEAKKDSLIATLRLRLCEFDALVEYTNSRSAPKDARHYFQFKYQNRLIVFKCFNYLDVKNIWLIRKNKTLLKFDAGCYNSVHSLLE